MRSSAIPKENRDRLIGNSDKKMWAGFVNCSTTIYTIVIYPCLWYLIHSYMYTLYSSILFILRSIPVYCSCSSIGCCYKLIPFIQQIFPKGICDWLGKNVSNQSYVICLEKRETFRIHYTYLYVFYNAG